MLPLKLKGKLRMYGNCVVITIPKAYITSGELEMGQCYLLVVKRLVHDDTGVLIACQYPMSASTCDVWRDC